MWAGDWLGRELTRSLGEEPVVRGSESLEMLALAAGHGQKGPSKPSWTHKMLTVV